MLHAFAHAAALRTNWVKKKVPTGLSQLTASVVRDACLAETNVSLHILPDGSATTASLEFQSILADEEALNSLFYIQGASGFLPCGIMCSVVNKQRTQDKALGLKRLTQIDPSLADISCNDLDKCGLRTDSDVWALFDLLATTPKKDLAEAETACGLKFHPQCFLGDQNLRRVVPPVSACTFDPMHVVFSNGILGVEMMNFLTKLRTDTGAYFKDVREYQQTQGWRPETKVFSEARENSSNDVLKAQAAELLEAYPLLCKFACDLYGENAKEPHVKSFMLLCEICDILSILLKSPSLPELELWVQRLRPLIKEYLAAFVDAYGPDAVRYKHHQLLHLPDMILKNKRMLACFVNERNNKNAKAAMEPCLRANQKQGQWEKSVLARLLNAQLRLLESPSWLSELGDGATECPELAQAVSAAKVRFARSMRWNGAFLASGYAVFLNFTKTDLVVVAACCEVDEGFALLVRCCAQRSRGRFHSTWKVDEHVSLYRLKKEPILRVSFKRYTSEEILEVLH
jgi:hypothetical protein